MRLVAVVILGIAVLFAGSLAFDRYKTNQWLSKFEEAMHQHRRVRLGDLVEFKWDKVFIVRSYDLTLPLINEIYGTSCPPLVQFGYSNEHDWRIIYRRPSARPFEVVLDGRKWQAPRRGKLWNSDQQATLRWIDRGDPLGGSAAGWSILLARSRARKMPGHRIGHVKVAASNAERWAATAG